METVLDHPHFATRPRQGVGAHLLGRLGGAVRNAIAGSLSLAGVLRRPAAPQPGIGHTVVRNACARPVPGEPRASRRQHAESDVLPARPGWLVQLLHRRRSAPATQQHGPHDTDAPFTQEEFPGLSPEACAFFSTPLEDLDPTILPHALRAFAEKIAELMPPEADMGDAQELFSSLLGGFTEILEARSGAPPEAASDTAPAAATAALPDAPVDALPAVLLVSSDAAPETHAAAPHQTIAASTGWETTADTPSQPELPSLRPVLHGCCPAPNRSHTFLHSNEPTYGYCRRRLRYFRSLFRRGPWQRLPSRHWCYAARASPA